MEFCCLVSLDKKKHMEPVKEPGGAAVSDIDGVGIRRDRFVRPRNAYLQKGKQDSAHNNMQTGGVDHPEQLYVTAFVVNLSIGDTFKPLVIIRLLRVFRRAAAKWQV